MWSTLPDRRDMRKPIGVRLDLKLDLLGISTITRLNRVRPLNINRFQSQYAHPSGNAVLAALDALIM
jgi:hypothetical protein